MARNVDGTINKSGTITSFVDLSIKVDRQTMNFRLLATELGIQKIIPGFPWLNEHNPDINWQTGELKWRTLQPLKVKRYHDKTPPEEKKEHPIRLVKMDDNLEIKLHLDSAHIPTWGSAGAAGYDLYSAENKVIPAKGKMAIDTQIFIATPAGTYGRIAPQSGLAAKNMITTGAGVIDVDYRGIVFVLLFNHSDQDLEVKQGDQIATPKIEQVNDLDETVRGSQGFGSLKKKKRTF